MNKVKVKKVKIPPREPYDLLEIFIITSDGEEFSFVADTWEVLDSSGKFDRKKLEEILLDWKTRIIPRLRKAKALTKEKIISIAKEMEGIEI